MQEAARDKFYGSFSIEEAKDVGKKFKAKCHANYGYDDSLTVGKIYEITISPRILPMSPLCSFTDDNGKGGEAHLERFTKMEE